MKFERFEEIIVYQKSKELAIEIYKCFSMIKDFGFKDQIQRAVISISNNIAEGYERKSNNEFKHFLFIAKGSSGEVRNMLDLAKELGYIPQQRWKELNDQSLTISKMISALIKTL
ncbi:MAG: four helix bundle protein [Ignavibacteriales bacterium]|nr:four helix bundle protein [Ignavibacteriales bacterium]